MQDLQLIGVHEDGEHLLLSGPGDKRFRMPVDDALRAAIRRDRPRLGQLQIEVDGGLRPRDVQALIRAGASADEAARRAGWSVEKVHRYEGPILAEREHVAGLAQQARLRSRSHGANSGTPTLSVRVTERLKERDVEVTDASWDSWRTEGRPWTVVLTFAAGGRQRQASWTFDLADRTVSAVDDEARWLSEEVQAPRGPIPAPRQQPVSGGRTTVYDVEAEGGLRPGTQEEHHEDPLDLMTAMRKRSTARGRRKSGGRSGPAAASPSPAGVDTVANDDPAQATLHRQVEERQVEQRQVEERQVEERQVEERQVEERQVEERQVEQRHLESQAPSGFAPVHTHEDHAQDGPLAGQNAQEDAAAEPVEQPVREARSKPSPKRGAREAARKPGRPSVPAWDEIMFGSKSGVDRSS